MTLGAVLRLYPSSIITLAIGYAFLWLALYTFRVNPEDDESKLAAGAMIVIFLYLLHNVLVETAVGMSQMLLYQRTLWWLPLAPVFWLHLSQKATAPLNFKGTVRGRAGACLNLLRKPAVLGALYGIALLLSVSGALTDGLFRFSAVKESSLPLIYQPLPTGPIYVVFALFVFVTGGVAWINFLSEWWQERKAVLGRVAFLRVGARELLHTAIPFSKIAHRSKFWWLSFGSILFWISSGGLLIKSLTGIRPVVPVGDLVLGFGMAIVAFATLKYNALVKREALERDAVYAWIGALAIALVYAGGMMLGQANPLNTPIAALAVIIALALTTHMLIDPLKIYFSQVVGVRLGIMSPGDIKEMEQLYREASRVKRRRHPAVELFENDERTVKRLLDLLTPRQREIITLRAKGLSDKQIADVLAIKLPTVRKHIEDIKERLGSRDKADCAVYCIVTGLLSKEDLDDWFDSLKIGEVQE